MSHVVGIDGWRGGWVATTLGQDGAARLSVSATLEELLAAHDAAQVVGVDMPIGLLEGFRSADQEARALLGPRRSSVFDVPPRRVLECDSYDQANETAKATLGRGISRQSYGLRAKIFEVEAVARDDDRLVEIHPELSFAALAGQPLSASKKSWVGYEARRALLLEAGVLPTAEDSQAVELARVPPDDVLDSAVVAWSAKRVAAGVARCLPETPERTLDGRPVAIWS